MNRINKFFAALLCVLSFVSFSCYFHFEDKNIEKSAEDKYPNLKEIKIDGETYRVANENKFDGEVNVRSDKTGIHIDVILDEDKKYDLLTLYKLEKGGETLVGEIKPVDNRFCYMADDSIPVGGSVIHGSTETENENVINSSYRTNYLAAGTHTFDLFFVEPGKTYTFFVCARENEGYFKNVTNGEQGRVREISYKNNFYGYRSYSIVLNHFVKKFNVTAASDFKAPSIAATYNAETGDYTFSKTYFVNKGLPVNFVSEEDISFSVGVSYQLSQTSTEGSFTMSYGNQENPVVYNLPNLIEKDRKAKYQTPYIFGGGIANLSYTDHFGKKYSECTTDAAVMDYYRTWYSLKSYSYANMPFGGADLPDNISIPDHRMKINVKATEKGNEISFNLLSSTDEIKIFNAEDEENAIGTMEGNFEAEKDYTFTDYLATPGKEVTYFVTWNDRYSSDATVKTLESLKYYPTKGTATFDEETMVYTVTENPFKDCLPEKFEGKMTFKYDNSKGASLEATIYDSTTEEVLSNHSYEERYSGKTLSITSPVTVEIGGVVNSIIYTNTTKIDSTFNFVKEIKFKSNYVAPDNGDNGNGDNGNGDNGNVDDDNLVDVDLNSTKEREKFIEDYLKENCPYSPIYKKNDLPKVTGIKETDEGLEVSLYIPSWLNYVYLDRQENATKKDESGLTVVDYESSKISYYFFNAEKFKNGNITVMDYNIRQGKHYLYTIEFYAYGKSNTYNSYGYEVQKYNDSTVYPITLIATKDSPYKVSEFPSVTVVEKNVTLENKNLGWKTLPAGYKNIDEYDCSHLHLENASKMFRNKSGNSVEVKYMTVEKASKDSFGWRGGVGTLYYYCYEVDSSDYFEDEYGNVVNQGFSEDERLHKFKYSESIGWKECDPKFQVEIPPFIKGKYKVSDCSYGMFNDTGMWLYNSVNFDDSAANTTFEIK